MFDEVHSIRICHSCISTKELLKDQVCEIMMLGVFGVYGQSRGENYGFEQILNCASMRRMQLFHWLVIEEKRLAMHKKHPTRECCDGEISEDELNMIDDIISAVDC